MKIHALFINMKQRPNSALYKDMPPGCFLLPLIKDLDLRSPNVDEFTGLVTLDSKGNSP